MLERLLPGLKASRWGGQRDGPLKARCGTPLCARRFGTPLRTRSIRAPLRARSALDDRLALRLGDGPPRRVRTRAALDDRLALRLGNLPPRLRHDDRPRDEDRARDDV